MPRASFSTCRHAASQILRVHVRDFQLAARRGLQCGRNLDDVVVVEVEPGDGVGRFGMGRLLFQADDAAVRVEFHDAIALGIANRIPEYGRATFPVRGLAQVVGKMGAVKNVVAERQGDSIGADELPADDERLREPVRARLAGILNRQAEVAAVAEQAPEAVLFVRRGDHQDVSNAGQHQRRQRVVHHRLAVHRQQLFAGAARQRVQPRARTAGENDAFQTSRRS